MMEFTVERALPLHTQIERRLRAQIREGRLKAGDRLPSADTLAHELAVHPMTVQKALRRLKTEGLVLRTRQRGTYVGHSEKMMNISVLFGPSLTDENAFFYRALLKAFRKDESRPGWLWQDYDGLGEADAGQPLNQLPGYCLMQRDWRAAPFVGIVAVGLSQAVLTAVQAACPCPIVVLAGSRAAANVIRDFDHFAWESVSHFARRQCRRIVYFRTMHGKRNECDDLKGFHRAIRQHAIPDWKIEQIGRLHGSHYDEKADYESMRAVVRSWQECGQWPDAVMISDDTAMRGLAHALIHAGDPHVAQVSLLTWANREVPFFYGLPVARYEVSVKEFAERLIELLVGRMNGQERPLVTRVRGEVRIDS